jgi:hypothetical protein
MNDLLAASQNGGGKQDRRKSQRSLLVMPLAVSWTTQTGMRVREHAETEVVSASGALIRMKTKLAAQTILDMKRPTTNQSAQVRVVTTSNPGPDGWVRIGVEFVDRQVDYWGISFPPMDEAPAEPAAQKKPKTLAELLAARPANPPQGKPASNILSGLGSGSAPGPVRVPSALTPARTAK